MTAIPLYLGEIAVQVNELLNLVQRKAQSLA